MEDPKNSVVRTAKVGLSAVKILNARDAFDRIAETLKRYPYLVLVDSKTERDVHGI